MQALKIYKIGGKVLDNKEDLENFLDQFCQVESPKILVHGGGTKASQLATQLDIPVQMHEGRRITSAAMLDVATMVYAGLLNTQLVASITKRQQQALGISGAALQLLNAEQRQKQPIDYGFVGDVKAVDALSIKKLLHEGTVLVFSAITADDKGQLLNTNADTIATDLAIALQAHFETTLSFCFEQTGVLHDGNKLDSLATKDYDKLKEDDIIYGGMIPKLDNGFRALAAGVSTVSIGSFSKLGIGTFLISSNSNSNKQTVEEDYSNYTSIETLVKLVSTPSYSREENETAQFIAELLYQKTGQQPSQSNNNILCYNRHYTANKPTILLCSHHDTVKAVKGWTYEPFAATFEGDKVYGLGTNDAGASLVALMYCFLHFYDVPDLPFNLVFAAVAEEEISGAHGVQSILPLLGDIDFCIVGEPTQMQLACAEKGLMVLDCTAKGKAGHAAHKNGINAIEIAIKDIEKLATLQLNRVSDLLGTVNISTTQIQAGYQHNIIPNQCSFVVDVRSNGLYKNEELHSIIQSALTSEVKARSFRLQSSQIDAQHPIVTAATKLGISNFGSSTLSDQALLPFPSVKIGPGDSLRSHTANEFIFDHELTEAITIYIQLLKHLN